MKVFRTDIWIAATVYVKADDEEAAAKIVNRLDFDGIELQEQELYGEDFAISGARFDSDELPDVSLSPAMTIYTRKVDGMMNSRPMITADEMEDAG